MARQDQYEFDGEVLLVRGNNNYIVRVTFPNGKEVETTCHLSGKMRQFKIKVLAGDPVKVIVPPPFTIGRITFRGAKDTRVKRGK